MEQIRRKNLERTQLDMLKTLRDYLDLNCRSVTSVGADELEALGIVRWTDLDVDGQLPYDSEPRFFSPCHEECPGLEEETEEWRPLWRATLESPKHLLDPEWVPSAGYVYASVKARWFQTLLDHLADRYDAEIHPATAYKCHSDPRYAGPRGYCGDDWYECEPCMVPVAADKPHMMITVFEPAVAPEGSLLWSEFNAVIALLESRIRIGQFTDHHTKPVLIIAFQRDTHARITQAHIDAKTNNVVIRQSRQLELVGAPGEPPADAYLLLRWMLNSPVSATKYDDEELPGKGARQKDAETGRAEMPIAPELVGVNSA
ncbi:c616493d-c862-4b8f-9802-65a3f0e494ed [Thermothielavioides terrestris]|uniref:C616493d-c862-4b8f-9802-65a3f0e494ed n=1 Tax=Thermothielavioides terrestris TaxID=2587410 RepID=A0A446BC53_9PEZI|nr:c616493d-c862-4b8f-9802-65a3f0e494ed [Thermothielavioides terrestris]